MNRLKECRLEKGYSQKYVALAIGVASPTVSMWESEIKNPSRESMMKLADLYGVSVDYLVGRVDGEKEHAPKEPSAMTDEELQDELVKTILSLDDAGRQRVKDFLAGMNAK